MSRLLIMIKPWSIHNSDQILDELDKYGTRLKTVVVPKVPFEVISEHYLPYKDEYFYEDVLSDFQNKKIILALYDGQISKFNKIKKEIRARYSFDIPPATNRTRNAIHISDTESEASRELKVWAEYLK